MNLFNLVRHTLLQGPPKNIEIENQICEPQGVNWEDSGFAWFKFDLFLSILSGLLLGLVALMIFQDTRLQAHPNKLIAYSCLFNSYNFFNFSMRYITCGYGWNDFLN